MTDVVHPANLTSGTASRGWRLAARLGRSLCAIVLARATRRALSGLPDDVLKDIGLTRGGIPFVASAIADLPASAESASEPHATAVSSASLGAGALAARSFTSFATPTMSILPVPSTGTFSR